MRSIFLLMVMCLALPSGHAAGNNLARAGYPAGERSLAVSEIPEALMENAVAVVRVDEKHLEVDADGSAEMECRYAVTVLNENGKEYAYFIRSYNKFMKYRRISGTIYDAKGKKLRKIKSGDIHDVSNIASYSLYEDKRAKVIVEESSPFPYTVEYTYTLVLKSVLSYPTWQVIPGYDISVQHSEYTVKMPQGEQLKFYPVGMELEPETLSNSDYEIYQWKAEDLPAIRKEPLTRNIGEYFPGMYLGPVEFEYGGVQGSAETWEDYGKWIWKLVEDKQEFTPETEEEIREVYQDCTTDREIVECLYRYMQDRVRYVNISVGLGGLEPIEAQRVHEVSYGDCKALSNYMAALLKVAGVKSVYTAVNAGSNSKRIHKEHPSMLQFNHAILMVPMEEDSIWLECTSQRLLPGYLGSFTDDRTVLFIDEKGGQLGRSPAFPMNENCRTTNAEVILHDDLSATIVRDRWYGGWYFGDKYSEILHLDQVKQKRRIPRGLEQSGFTLTSFSYDYRLEDPVHVKQHIEVEDDAFLTPSGDYIMLQPNVVSSGISLPTRVRDRSQEVYIRRPGMITDTIVYNIPGGIAVEQLPDPCLVSSDFGTYRSEIRQDGDRLVFIRHFEYYSGYFPPGRYDDYYSYYKEVIRADNQQVVLKVM